MFPEDPKDAELGDEAEDLLSHWPLTDKSPEEWEDLAARIDARIKITQVGSTPDYLLESPLLEDHEVQRRSQPLASLRLAVGPLSRRIRRLAGACPGIVPGVSWRCTGLMGSSWRRSLGT